MSAFDRLAQSYRDLCQQIAKNSPRASPAQREVQLSPQNQRVRFRADLHLASQKASPNRDTRQQRRAAARPWKKRAA
jgi:uncharacterized membrane-anchored protein YhcB (DUF1043 family)